MYTDKHGAETTHRKCIIKPTDFLKELLNVDSISGTSLDENSCNRFSKLLSFLHRDFPVKEKETTVSEDVISQLTRFPSWQINILIINHFQPFHL